MKKFSKGRPHKKCHCKYRQVRVDLRVSPWRSSCRGPPHRPVDSQRNSCSGSGSFRETCASSSGVSPSCELPTSNSVHGSGHEALGREENLPRSDFHRVSVGGGWARGVTQKLNWELMLSVRRCLTDLIIPSSHPSPSHMFSGIQLQPHTHTNSHLSQNKEFGAASPSKSRSRNKSTLLSKINHDCYEWLSNKF